MERLACALVSVVATALTLMLFPVVTMLLSHGSGGPGQIEFGFLFYKLAFSKTGLITVLAAVAGFCLGSERMANIFSFFWGTHPFWADVRDYIEDQLAEFQANYNAPLCACGFLLAILIGVLLLNRT